MKGSGGRNYSFIQNRACEYFPCHAGVPEEDFNCLLGVPEEDFNCLFCYCPLYALGEDCGGNCRYLASGVKDCSGCAFPHLRGNYEKIIGRFPEIAALAAERRKT